MASTRLIPRQITADDTPALADTFREAVMQLGNTHYDADQCQAWAASADDPEAFGRALTAGLTLCIDIEGQAVAFGQLNPVDQIAMLYCHPAHTGKGYASAILLELEAYAREQGVTHITVKASRVAQPFFLHHGYRSLEEEQVVRAGIAITRFSMEKRFPS